MKNLQMSFGRDGIIKSCAVSISIFILAVSLSAFMSVMPNGDQLQSTTTRSAGPKFRFQTLFPPAGVDPGGLYATQLNSRVIPFVQAYIRSDSSRLAKMKIWGKNYFAIYDRILGHYGLPKQLKYLSVIESDLVSKAVSVSGAVGPWQIMPEEATRMGLTVNSEVDERTSFKKSTHAAAKILKELYAQFNDWTLVIAAYNCGAGRVRQAIRKSGSKNFWALQSYLPLETRYHVKRFIGTHYILEGSGGLTTMTASELRRYHIKAAATQNRQWNKAVNEYYEKLVDMEYVVM